MIGSKRRARLSTPPTLRLPKTSCSFALSITISSPIAPASLCPPLPKIPRTSLAPRLPHLAPPAWRAPLHLLAQGLGRGDYAFSVICGFKNGGGCKDAARNGSFCRRSQTETTSCTDSNSRLVDQDVIEAGGNENIAICCL